MNLRFRFLATTLSIFHAFTFAGGQSDSPAPRHITLHEAVELALKHNHVVRIAGYQVEEKQHAKEIARSAYFPVLRNDSVLDRLTDTQFVQIPAGSLGIAGGTLIPPQSATINQGGRTVIASGTSLIQPLTQLLKIKPKNDIARAELNATRGKAQETQNDVAFKVHQLYYNILIEQSHRNGIDAKIKAAQELQRERVEQVKHGAALDTELIESRAQSLQATQELLTIDFQLSDLMLQFNEAIGLPLKTKLALDPNTPEVTETCQREECVQVALKSHPEIIEAREEVQKASSAVRLAKTEYVPDISAFARYAYQDNVPFLARNYGAFGIQASYDLFDGGRKRAALREREAQLAQANENLARVTEGVELRVQTAYNKLERTRQMMKVSQELLAVRAESSRVSAQQLKQGAALKSQAQAALAQEFEATTLLLQAQLDYILSRDAMTQAIGRTPE